MVMDAQPHVNAAKIEALGHRVDNIEELTKSIHKMSANVQLLAQKQDGTDARVSRIGADVAEIKAKGGKRWEAVVSQLINLAVAAIAAGVIAKLL